MTRAGAMALLLVPLLAVGGLTAGAVVSAEGSARAAESEAALSAAYSAAQDVRTAALALHDELAEADVRAADAIAAAEAVLATVEGTVEGDDRAELSSLIDNVMTLRFTPAAIPDLPGDLVGLERWGDRIDGWLDASSSAALDGAVSALRAAVYSAAGTASTTAQSVLDANGGASAESRSALSTAMADLASVIDTRGDAAVAVGAVASAAQAVKDSAAANAVPAQTGSSGAGGGGGFVDRTSYEAAYNSCHTYLQYRLANPIMIADFVNGGTRPETQDEIMRNFWPCTVEGPGYSWVIYG